MSLTIVFVLLALAGITGVVLGYVLRWLVALGQRGSLELEIKQTMLEAKERAAKILAEAEIKAEVVEAERAGPLKERDEKLTKTEERLVKKEEFLDERQRDLDREAEGLKGRAEDVARLKSETEDLLREREKALEKISHLSQQEARGELLRAIEHSEEETLVMRLQKLE